ncbi:uncharacterized protein PHA67_005000 [Liasis olivaceus]
MEFPPWEELQQVKQEPEEQLSQSWKMQWPELLRTAESPPCPWGFSPLPKEPWPWDNAKAFLGSFEQVAQACRWPWEEWASRLLPALRGEAEQAYRELARPDQEDYGKVKAAILHRDALSREKQRQHFRRFRYQEAEGPRGAYSRLQALCHQWLKVERLSKGQILETLVLEQLLAVLPPKMQGWVREQGPESCSQAVALAEEYQKGQQDAEAQEQQRLGSFVKQAADSSEVKQMRVDMEGGLTCQEVKMESAEEASLVASRELSQKEQHPTRWENVEKAGGPQMTLAPVEWNFSPRWEMGEANEPVLGRPEGHEAEGRTEVCHPRELFRDKPHEAAPLHPAAHKGKGKNICSDCGKSFKWNSRLVTHRRLHTGEKPYQCSLCGKRFRRNAHLGQHHRVHTGEKPYECPNCGKSFNDKSTFLKHQRTHTGDKPYKCSHCGKRFIQSSHLSRHQRTHTGEKL